MSIRVSVLLLSFGLIVSGCASRNITPGTAANTTANTVVTSNETPLVAEFGPNDLLIPAADSTNNGISGSQPREGCRAAAAAAERRKGLPPGLLTAIASTESGLHPTALRINGRGIYPASKQAAAVAAKQALSRSQNVMAGCMQVNLKVHDPKGQLWALEPGLAADWAAGYLLQLHHRLGSWQSAISAYGGDSGRTYVRRVERQLDTGLPEEVAEAPQ